MLLTLPNPKHNEIINRYNHLDGIQMHDNDTKNLLPIHIILGTSDFAKIKMGTDWWTICWVIMSLDRESDIGFKVFLSIKTMIMRNYEILMFWN